MWWTGNQTERPTQLGPQAACRRRVNFFNGGPIYCTIAASHPHTAVTLLFSLASALDWRQRQKGAKQYSVSCVCYRLPRLVRHAARVRCLSASNSSTR